MELKLYELVLSKASNSKDIQNLIKSFYDPIEDNQRKLKKELLTFFDYLAIELCERKSKLFKCLEYDKENRKNLNSDTNLGFLVDGLYYHNNGYVEEIGREKASILYRRYAFKNEDDYDSYSENDYEDIYGYYSDSD